MNHIFTHSHMGIAHKTMLNIIEQHDLPFNKGDIAIFVNKSWTAAKILTARCALSYYRMPFQMDLNILCNLPKMVGGKPLQLSPHHIAVLTKTVPQRRSRALAKNVA